MRQKRTMQPTCSPLALDSDLSSMIEAYRRAKTDAVTALKKRAELETAGHYDKDATDPRAWLENDAALAERRAAIALADELLKWVDGRRA